MAIEVSRKEKADISAGRCSPELGRVSLDLACQGESNGIGFEASAWLKRSARRKREIPQQADIR